MVAYNTVNVKLSNSQLNKLKSLASNQTGVTLRMNIKFFNGNNLPNELLLKTKEVQKCIWKKYTNWYMLSKGQISIMIKSGGFLGSLLSKLAGPLMKVAVPIATKLQLLLQWYMQEI